MKVIGYYQELFCMQEYHKNFEQVVQDEWGFTLFQPMFFPKPSARAPVPGVTDPGATGGWEEELIVKIRQWEKDHQVEAPAVVVAVTAHVDYKSKGQAALGFNAVMQKPLTMEKLELLFRHSS